MQESLSDGYFYFNGSLNWNNMLFGIKLIGYDCGLLVKILNKSGLQNVLFNSSRDFINCKRIAEFNDNFVDIRRHTFQCVYE